MRKKRRDLFFPPLSPLREMEIAVRGLCREERLIGYWLARCRAPFVRLHGRRNDLTGLSTNVQLRIHNSVVTVQCTVRLVIVNRIPSFLQVTFLLIRAYFLC